MDSTKTLERIHDLIDLSLLAAATLGTEIWWRGHSRAEWNLVPSVRRGNRKPSDEMNLAVRFFQHAPTRYARCPPESDFPGWLFLMQHYRLPTRLLDWTESILIAAYFACSEHQSHDAALWALSPYLLNKAETGEQTLFTPNHPHARQLFRPPFTDKYDPSEATLAILAREMDLRMTVQLSAFSIHGSSTPLELNASASQFLLKFDIPAVLKKSVVTHLFYLGIRESSLFPDLEHLAAELSSLQFDVTDPPQKPDPDAT